MELTSRRFAIFLASGLTLAVVVGLAVWKISDAGMNLTSTQTEVAGQPIAAADADESSTPKTAASSEASSTAEGTEEEASADDADAELAGEAASNDSNGAQGTGSGAAYDPLAPRNANLGGARGGSQETSYYRPTNAAPAQPNTRTSTPEQTQQPDNAGRTPTQQGDSPRKTATPNSTTAVPQEPQEPQKPQPVPGNDPDGAAQHEPEPQQPSADAGAERPQIASEIAEKVGAGGAVSGTENGQGGEKPKRPEDPFSASTRVPHAPAEDDGTERGAEANG